MDESTDSDTLMGMRSNEMGMDSLIAVDLRSWILKNYSVSIPVLEILGGVSIAELVDRVLQKVPPELVPNVAPAASDDGVGTAAARKALIQPPVTRHHQARTSQLRRRGPSLCRLRPGKVRRPLRPPSPSILLMTSPSPR